MLLLEVYVIDISINSLLCISQLLSKNWKVILSAPRSWRQVCAIRNSRKSLRLLSKVWIAQTCLHDLGADKMTLQVLLRSWEMMSNFEVQQQHQSGMNHTTWHESVTNLAEMNNCRGFGQNVVQYRSPLRTYNPQQISMQQFTKRNIQEFEVMKPFS